MSFYYNVNQINPSLSFSHMKKTAEMASPLKQIFVYDRGSQYDLLETIKGSFMWVSPVPQEALKGRGLIVKTCKASSVINKDTLIYQKGHNFSSFEKEFLSKLDVEV
ncbi:MAG: hypothetical protein RR483_06045 [Clostridia bacterium]